MTCEQCKTLEEKNKKLRAALVRLVGGDGKEFLGPMRVFLSRTIPEGEEKVVSLNAIDVLLETL